MGYVYSPAPGRNSAVMNAMIQPWLHISCVCRHWHDVAISTPSLWRLIILPPWSSFPFDRIVRQLKQSQNVPIDILVHLRNPYDAGYSHLFIFTLCLLLLPHIDRWCSFELRTVSARQMSDILNEITRTCLPVTSNLKLTAVKLVLLDDITSYDYGQTPHDILSKPFTLFGRSAPYLEDISLVGLKVDWNQAWISSASHLTTLEIKIRHDEDYPSWTQFATILHSASRLRVLVFEDFRESVDPAWVDPILGSMSGDHSTIPIQLLELKELYISLPTTVIVQLLRRCYIPALEKLDIWPLFNRDEEHNELEALVAQLVEPMTPCSSSQVQPPPPRSLVASVQDLSIRWNMPPNHDDQCIDTLCANLNQLTSLSLHLAGGDASIDFLFTPTGQICDVVLPRLKNLTILDDWNYLRIRDICALAWQRKDIGVPFNALILRGVGKDHLPDECLFWFQQNLEKFDFVEESVEYRWFR